METSAKENINVSEAFFKMSEQIYYNMKSTINNYQNEVENQINEAIGVNINIYEEKKEEFMKKKKCC